MTDFLRNPSHLLSIKHNVQMLLGWILKSVKMGKDILKDYVKYLADKLVIINLKIVFFMKLNKANSFNIFCVNYYSVLIRNMVFHQD